MQNQDESQFEILFGGLFQTTLRIIDRHLRVKDEHFSKPNFKIAADTILDLLDLSGLTLLFSELHGTSFYEITKAIWDAYFAANPNGALVIQLFYDSIEMTLQLPALSASSTRRFNWERSFVRAMANVGFDIDGRMSSWEGDEPARTEHKSRIIQSIRPHMGMTFNRSYNFFAAFYLSERTEASELKLPDSALVCKEDVDRERKQREGDKE